MEPPHTGSPAPLYMVERGPGDDGRGGSAGAYLRKRVTSAVMSAAMIVTHEATISTTSVL